MHHTHRGVAVTDLVDQDPHAHQVVDVVEIAAPHDHLLMDRVVVLGAALHLRCQPGGVELSRQLVDDRAQVGVARRRAVSDQAHDLVVFLGLQDGERQILQFPFDRGHAQSVRQRGQHFEGLARLAGLLLRRQETHGAHVVQPVGELDHQHPGVAGHRDDHLADGLGLRGRPQFDLVQLGDAVDQVRHLVAELGAELVQGVVGVLDGVVQQAGHQRGGVHTELGQNRRDRQRVRDVRVARLAPLTAVLLLGDVVGALEQREVRLRVEFAVHGGERLKHLLDRGGPLRRDSPGQPGADATGRGGRTRLGNRIGCRSRRFDVLAHRTLPGSDVAFVPGPGTRTLRITPSGRRTFPGVVVIRPAVTSRSRRPAALHPY